MGFLLKKKQHKQKIRQTFAVFSLDSGIKLLCTWLAIPHVQGVQDKNMCKMCIKYCLVACHSFSYVCTREGFRALGHKIPPFGGTELGGWRKGFNAHHTGKQEQSPNLPQKQRPC